jgi:hypothetical protein
MGIELLTERRCNEPAKPGTMCTDIGSGRCQFPDGFSMLSMTMTSTGPFRDTSLNPNCSGKAVKIVGAEDSKSGS